MHNKFCVIDEEILITGSFNWTDNAEISLENALMIAGDYRLIKSYLHEFEDLKHYSKSNSLLRPRRYLHDDNSPCASLTYNVGVFGYPDGTTGAQNVTIWEVCKKHQMVKALQKICVDASFDDEDDLESLSNPNWHEGREEMLEQFQLERRIMNDPRRFLSLNMRLEVHAYGTVQPVPQSFKVDDYCDSDYCLELSWRHMYWRKIIPSRLEYDDGDVWKIIESHRPGALNAWRGI